MASRVRSLGRFIARCWLILGSTLLVMTILDFALLTLVPDPHRSTQIDPSAKKLSKRLSDVFRGVEWAADYWREYAESRSMRWDHFGLWRRQPFSGRHLNVGPDGRRNTLNPSDRDQRVRIFVFGGSTVWGTGARDRGTLPSQLSTELWARGIAVEVVNFGEAGYVLAQERIALERALRSGDIPGLAIFYDGVNDVYSALQNGRAGLPVNEARRVREFNLTLSRRHLLGGWPAFFPGVKRLRGYAFAGTPARPFDAEELAREVVDHYAWLTDRIASLGERYGCALRFYWQPVLFTKQQLSTSEIQSRDWSDGRLRDLHRVAQRLVSEHALLRRSGRFRDLSSVLDGEAEPLFMDHSHLSERGNRLVASAMVSDLVAAAVLEASGPPRARDSP